GVLDRPAQAGQEAPALGRGSSAPWTVGSAVAVEGAPGAGHGEADIGAATPGDRPEYRAVRRIDDLEPVAIERGARYVVDEETALDDFGTIGGHGGARAVSLSCAILLLVRCTMHVIIRDPRTRAGRAAEQQNPRQG